MSRGVQLCIWITIAALLAGKDHNWLLVGCAAVAGLGALAGIAKDRRTGAGR